MGQSSAAKIAWGIDLGTEEDWYEGKLEPLRRRFLPDDDEYVEDPEGDGSFYDWSEKALPALYIDKAAREKLVSIMARVPRMRILKTEIPHLALISEVGGSGQTIFEYQGRSRAAREYLQLTKEVLGWLEQTAVQTA